MESDQLSAGCRTCVGDTRKDACSKSLQPVSEQRGNEIQHCNNRWLWKCCPTPEWYCLRLRSGTQCFQMLIAKSSELVPRIQQDPPALFLESCRTWRQEPRLQTGSRIRGMVAVASALPFRRIQDAAETIDTAPPSRTLRAASILGCDT